MDAVWEKLHCARSWGKYPAERLITRIMRQFKQIEDRAQLRVLEVGCGAGANLSFFLNEGFSVTGIDGSESAIKNAEARLKNLQREGQEFNLEVMTFNQMDFDTDSFDIAVDYFSLCCTRLSEAKKNIENIRRMLKPGAYFYQRTFGTDTDGFESGEVLEPGTSLNPTSGPFCNMGVTHCFSIEELQTIYSNWSVVEITRTLDIPYENSDARVERWEIWAKK